MDICGSLMDIFDENPARSANKKTFLTKKTQTFMTMKSTKYKVYKKGCSNHFEQP